MSFLGIAHHAGPQRQGIFNDHGESLLGSAGEVGGFRPCFDAVEYGHGEPLTLTADFFHRCARCLEIFLKGIERGYEFDGFAGLGIGFLRIDKLWRM